MNEFFREILSFRQSRNKLNLFSLFRLYRKDEISRKTRSTFLPNKKDGNTVKATFDFVEAKVDFVKRIVRLVTFHNVASTLLLMWEGLYSSHTFLWTSTKRTDLTVCLRKDCVPTGVEVEPSPTPWLDAPGCADDAAVGRTRGR